MTPPKARHRPPIYPPPEFPPRRPALFASTPPAVFPAVLCVLGLVLSLRTGPGSLGWSLAPADLLTGIALGLWAPASLFAAVAALTGLPMLATGFGVLALAILLVLAAAGRCITQAGFSPLWAAFTFPLVACAGR